MKKLVFPFIVIALFLIANYNHTTVNVGNRYVYSDDPFEIKNVEANESLDDFLSGRNNVQTDDLQLDVSERKSMICQILNPTFRLQMEIMNLK